MCDPIQMQYAAMEAGEVRREVARCTACQRPVVKVRHGKIHAQWSSEGGRPKAYGTFTWGADRPLVIGKVGRALRRRFTGVRLRAIEFHGRTRLSGDETIVDLDARHTVAALPQSTVKHSDACPLCGAQRLQLLGVEDDTWEFVAGDSVRIVIPRKPQYGLFVDAAVVEPLGYFDWNDRQFCTSTFKTAVEALGATNVRFAEWGEAVRR